MPTRETPSCGWAWRWRAPITSVTTARAIYPQGLRGEAIPLPARILIVADQYDALRNKRPYKPAFDAATTFDIITKGDGRSEPRHLDPRVLAAFTAQAADFEAIFEELNKAGPA
ncbi:MAG: HD domain-containing phosphohydrolase [Spirochaetota bacterium]